MRLHPNAPTTRSTRDNLGISQSNRTCASLSPGGPSLRARFRDTRGEVEVKTHGIRKNAGPDSFFRTQLLRRRPDPPRVCGLRHRPRLRHLLLHLHHHPGTPSPPHLRYTNDRYPHVPATRRPIVWKNNRRDIAISKFSVAFLSSSPIKNTWID